MRNKSVLIVAAHPDDEVLGCGATIAKHARAGDTVNVLILAEGATSRAGTRRAGLRSSTSALSALRTAARDAGKILGAARVSLAGFPDNRLDGLELLDVIKRVEKEISAVRPDAIYTHHAGDVNVDHQVTHDAVVTAARPQPGRAAALYFFETQSSTEWRPPQSRAPFTPTHFVDVSATLEAKMRALRMYSSEMRPWPHARSYEAIEHLARWRGATIGREAAEAFEAGRTIA